MDDLFYCMHVRAGANVDWIDFSKKFSGDNATIELLLQGKYSIYFEYNQHIGVSLPLVSCLVVNIFF